MAGFVRLSAALGLLLMVFWPGYALAGMSIDIVGGAASQIPVAIAPFLSVGSPGSDPSDVVRADLGHSGLFSLVDTSGLGVPGEAQKVSFPQWRARKADALVIGQISTLPDGRLDIRFRLYDVVRQTQLAGFSYVIAPAKERAIAHKIADIVYEKLVGVPGNFGGRIAYVLKHKGRYELQVADADGFNNVAIMRSPEPVISPVWSPDGNRVAYVSFEQKKPVVYVQDLASGQRKAVANFRGSNSAPAWSPDGKKLAIALSKDSSSQIYLIEAGGGTPERLTRGGALDTEPIFSQDGNWIYFTSDRGGSPQIYRMRSSGGAASRVTYDGTYNVSPNLSPDGRYLAFIHQDGGGFHVAVMELATGQTQVLTDTPQDESPHFAPNSRSILYATHMGGREVLATVSVDGRVKQRLSLSGELREPVWAP
jgi:TolB protein